jgi:hypothetical protein
MNKVIIYDVEPWHDASRYYSELHTWAVDHCPSYTYYDVLDISDASPFHDIAGTFFFDNEEDAVYFSFVWKEK